MWWKVNQRGQRKIFEYISGIASSLLIGNEVLDISVQDMKCDQALLVLRHGKDDEPNYYESRHSRRRLEEDLEVEARAEECIIKQKRYTKTSPIRGLRSKSQSMWRGKNS